MLRRRNQAPKADPRTLEGEWKSNVRHLNRTCSEFVCQAGRRRHNKRQIRVSMVLVTNENVDLRSQMSQEIQATPPPTGTALLALDTQTHTHTGWCVIER